MEEVLSDESCIVLCHAQAEGCPVGQVSRGYTRRFGYSQDECVGRHVCDHAVDEEALALGGGLPTPAAAAGALAVVAGRVAAKLAAMAADAPPTTEFALALNVTKAGELVPCELHMRLHRHPAVDWKSCIVVVVDISRYLSAKDLLGAAARGDEAFDDLTQARLASRARPEEGGGGGAPSFPTDATSSRYLDGLAGEMFRARLSGAADMLKSSRKGKKSATPSISSRSTSSGVSAISYVSSASSKSSASRATPASLAELASGEQQRQTQEPSAVAFSADADVSHLVLTSDRRPPPPQEGARAPDAKAAAPGRGLSLAQLALAAGAAPEAAPVAQAEDPDVCDFHGEPYFDLLEDYAYSATDGAHGAGQAPWPGAPVLGTPRWNFAEGDFFSEGSGDERFRDVLEEDEIEAKVEAKLPPPTEGVPSSWATFAPEVARARSDARLQQVVCNLARRELLGLNVPVVVADPAIVGCPFVACSDAFNDLVGCSRGEAIGFSWRHLRDTNIPTDPRIDAEIARLCDVASQHMYFRKGDGRGVSLLSAFEVKLPEGELTCAQWVAASSGRSVRCALHVKQVELDEEMFVIGVFAELPVDGRRHAGLRSIVGESAGKRMLPSAIEARTWAQLRDGMSTALQVLSSQFWLCTAMRHQVARHEISSSAARRLVSIASGSSPGRSAA